MAVVPATVSVVAGQSTQLAANVVVSGGAANTVTWSSGNTAIATVPMNKAFTMGANSSTLAVATLDGTLSFFNLPITSPSTPYASFVAGSDGTPLWVSETSLYQGGSGKINIARDPAGNIYIYTLPLTAASTPATTINVGSTISASAAVIADLAT